MSDEHRTITPAERAAQLEGATRIAPGIWIDRTGAVHYSIPELLQVFGWPDDTAHRALVEHAIRDFIHQQAPHARPIKQELES